MAKKLSIKKTKKPAVVITRNAIKTKKLVYIAVANKAIKYSYGRSRIVYIGTTKKGAGRIASSAASKAKQVLDTWGYKELEFFVVTCTPRPAVQTWHKLERALLLEFREQFGDVPECNIQGKKMKWTDESKYFTRSALRKVIEFYSA
jgi:hypothetical protein